MQVTKSFQIRATHNTDRQPFVRYVETTDPVTGFTRSVAEPAPHPWNVLCGSHARHRERTCAVYEVKPLEGEWECQECAKFDWDAKSRLVKALNDRRFAYTRQCGHYGEIGCIYFRDPSSPTGVRSAKDAQGCLGFDPFCPEAMAVVREQTKTSPERPYASEVAR